jgi:hypothetical protein
VLIGVIVFRVYEKQQNQAAFEQARLTIDAIYADVIKEVGPPDDQKRTNSCSKNFQEWGGGEISCDVSGEFIYGVDSQEQATKIYKSVQNIVVNEKNTFKPESPLSTSITDELVVDTYYHSAYDSFKTERGLKCVAKYVYDTPKDSYLKTPAGKKGLYITIGCFGGAKAPYYKLDN